MVFSTQLANDSHKERNSITELPKSSCKDVLGENSTGIEDEDFLEDQELVDSYEFDYHSYTDVVSSVSAGSLTDSELSDYEDEISEMSENEVVDKWNDNVEANKEGALEMEKNETTGAGYSEDKDCSYQVKDNTEVKFIFA
ncbi:hypothetical protein AA0116_g2824 [Alternaria tenuissima]|jgi:hypothetical protein|nr:hypothetical protein AA0116_g2824 [Alternaria tenuissima]